ncbi:hypothetical protein C2845_PM07G16110 [Panicum miliaceum]|uniref:Uncharacterized protein n=1 Tax=Panicum miliaceum TaxID=4540 RepID=A0A3L6SKB2_PANMI|nr:hypothetical protein C2845_PM07G16110 [Panicum miliaceum]
MGAPAPTWPDRLPRRQNPNAALLPSPPSGRPASRAPSPLSPPELGKKRTPAALRPRRRSRISISNAPCPRCLMLGSSGTPPPPSTSSPTADAARGPCGQRSFCTRSALLPSLIPARGGEEEEQGCGRGAVTASWSFCTGQPRARGPAAADPWRLAPTAPCRPPEMLTTEGKREEEKLRNEGRRQRSWEGALGKDKVC